LAAQARNELAAPPARLRFGLPSRPLFRASMGRRPCRHHACAYISDEYDIINYQYHIIP
jgi:hypothetical protein